MTELKNIVDTATNAGSFKTLLAAATAAGLVETLKSPGPFTVFAPTDDAFAKLAAGTVDDLLKPDNKAKLTSILKYHVVAGTVLSKDLADKKMNSKSLEGSDIAIDGTKGVKVGSGMVTSADVMASNGVIHIIDTVLMPPAK